MNLECEYGILAGCQRLDHSKDTTEEFGLDSLQLSWECNSKDLRKDLETEIKEIQIGFD